jgi:hypothetical protein
LLRTGPSTPAAFAQDDDVSFTGSAGRQWFRFRSEQRTMPNHFLFEKLTSSQDNVVSFVDHWDRRWFPSVRDPGSIFVFTFTFKKTTGSQDGVASFPDSLA